MSEVGRRDNTIEGVVGDAIESAIAKWEAELATLDLDAPLYLPLGDHELGVGAFHHHSIAYDKYGDDWRLIEVEGTDIDPTTYASRLLQDAPESVQREALRRLPTLYEAAAREEERRSHGTLPPRASSVG